MKRSRFTEEQIIAVLREQEAGMKTADICRKHGISDATFYKWKAKYGGLEVSEAKRLRALALSCYRFIPSDIVLRILPRGAPRRSNLR